MEEYAAKLLKQVLDQCQGASFSEIRFISGMSPAFVDDDGPHFLEVADLSQDLVGQIHELCLSLADESTAGAGGSRVYTFSLKRLGRMHCKYERRGNVASLVLVRESDAAATVEATRPRKRPSLKAGAKPGSKGKKA